MIGFGEKQDDTDQLFLPFPFCHIIAAVIIGARLIILINAFFVAIVPLVFIMDVTIHKQPIVSNVV
jgi:hypothetical protein